MAQAAEPEDYDDEADKEKDEEDYDVADQAPPPPSLYRSRDKEAVAEVAPPVSSYYAPRYQYLPVPVVQISGIAFFIRVLFCHFKPVFWIRMKFLCDFILWIWINTIFVKRSSWLSSYG